MPLFIAIIKKKRFTLAVLVLSLPLIVFFMGNFGRAAEDREIINAVLAMEGFYSFFITLAVSLIIKNRDEMMIAVTSNIKMKKLFFTEYMVILIFSLLPALALGIAIAPHWMTLKFIISLTVTVFFFTSFSLMIRVIINNHFANIGFCTVFFMMLYLNTIRNGGGGRSNIEYYLDLFINNYSHLIVRMGAESVWYVTESIWTINRIAFTILGIICLTVSMLLSERINILKNYKSN